MHAEELLAEWDRLETKQALAALLRGDSDVAADSLGRMTWSLLAELAREAGCPTEGPLAWVIWRKSNRECDAREAVIAMGHCGYLPFQGYPLVRQALTIPIDRYELTCTDGSPIVTYTFPADVPHHLRRRAYELAMERLKADWPETSQLYVATSGQGYSVHCPAHMQPCTCMANSELRP
jgi:hypothetical protein